jgi:hypothetical protein
MNLLLMIVLAGVLLAAAFYAQQQIPSYTSSRRNVLITRALLASVGLACGIVSSALYADDTATAVRTGTPRPIVERLYTEVARALELPEVRDPLVRQGLTPAPVAPDQFGAFIRSEMERNSRIIRTLNVKVD